MRLYVRVLGVSCLGAAVMSAVVVCNADALQKPNAAVEEVKPQGGTTDFQKQFVPDPVWREFWFGPFDETDDGYARLFERMSIWLLGRSKIANGRKVVPIAIEIVSVGEFSTKQNPNELVFEYVKSMQDSYAASLLTSVVHIQSSERTAMHVNGLIRLTDEGGDETECLVRARRSFLFVDKKWVESGQILDILEGGQ